MSKIVVIDASLAAMWAVPETYSNQALVLANQWAQEHARLIAPCLMLTEVTNAIYKRVARREMELDTGIAALCTLSLNLASKFMKSLGFMLALWS
jgi:predicted nucleic acid-binding protein